MSVLLDLAAKCEAASAPDRELDGAIGVVAGFRVVDEGHPLGLQCYTARGQSVPLPRFTASLDAAMSLAAEGMFLAFDPHFQDEDGCVLYKGYSFLPDWQKWTPHADWLNRSESPKLCATPALALCAAALRARADHLQSEGNR